MANKKRARKAQKEMFTGIAIGVLGLALLVLASSSIFNVKEEVNILHLHGLSFSPDGRQLIVPAHDGLRIYEAGEWLVPDVPPHDYMGYAAVDNGFYSSGHPHPGSGRINPLGLVKSTDNGQNLTRLAFEGESDFHLMGVGYGNHAIYVFNPSPNSKLAVGLHYSLDDGQTWHQCEMQGINASPVQLAVHPTEANIIALTTEGGLFLSRDYGNMFERVGDIAPVTGASFSSKGDKVYFGYQTLYAYDLSIGQVEDINTPATSPKEAIGFIAINPKQPKEIALATFEKDIFLSNDGGQTWIQIAIEGKGVEW